jgi:hypothetical protein
VFFTGAGYKLPLSLNRPSRRKVAWSPLAAAAIRRGEPVRKGGGKHDDDFRKRLLAFPQ